ncbi:uncharacterized protein [Watersipora subatra]|uniref:uncharacterized protein n=1 Tax=Watersipora subatra TaxID=2589382 RepID=UPI00355C606B
MIAFACNGNPVEESEVVAQLQADVEDLKGMFASIKTFIKEAVARNNPWKDKVRPPGPPGSPGIACRNGQDGADGNERAKGENGADGRDGADGLPGRDGNSGRDGVPGRDGEKVCRVTRENQVLKVLQRIIGETGPEGDPGNALGGFTGRAQLGNNGGGTNYQYMVYDAEYNSGNSVSNNFSYIAGTEYESESFGIFSNSAHNQNAPAQGRSTFECVDAEPEYIDEENKNDARFHFNTVSCSQGVPCPPYRANKAITCVVCTQ